MQTETYPNGLMLAGTAKQVNPETTVVMGGPHATVMYEQVLTEKSVDIVVRGEGELTMAELTHHLLRRKGTLGALSGIAYRQDGKIVVTSERPFIPDPDELPFPARELFPLPLYQQPVHVLMSRGGCPFKCVFCAVSNIWKGSRRFRSTENVLQEILSLRESVEFDEIHFADDTFTLSRERVDHLCKKLVERRDDIPWNWTCTTRADLVDPLS